MASIDLPARVRGLDATLFSHVPSETSEADRKGLLAVHAAAAARGSFDYLEIGSFLGGSMQVMIRDRRCHTVISIDSRPEVTPDSRGLGWQYEGNDEHRMRALLAEVPDADLSKLVTIDADTASIDVDDLPVRPHYCFIDGEHTNGAVLRDARFCAQAMGGSGVILFHDHALVRQGIRAFIDESRPNLSRVAALSFPRIGPGLQGGGVLAAELGPSNLLVTQPVKDAIDSTWHWLAWKIGSRTNSGRVVCAILEAMPTLDLLIRRIRGALPIR